MINRYYWHVEVPIQNMKVVFPGESIGGISVERERGLRDAGSKNLDKRRDLLVLPCWVPGRNVSLWGEGSLKCMLFQITLRCDEVCHMFKGDGASLLSGVLKGRFT